MSLTPHSCRLGAWPQSLQHSVPLLAILFLLTSLPSTSQQTPNSSNVTSKCAGAASAVFAFGDSTVDSGNNNFLPTPFRSNFPPYGRDFFDHIATGRFTNGKLATDYAASYLGLKDHLPPYLDLTLSQEELVTGVSFASAGCGYDLLTAQMTGVVPVPLQLDLFQTYIARLIVTIGKQKTDALIEDAVFILSAGTNDFVANYFSLPVRRKEFNVQEYETFLLVKIRDFLQNLQDLGARRVVVSGLPPMGCLPVVITLNWRGRFQERSCVEFYNSISQEFNKKLQVELQNNFGSGDMRALYADIYDPVMDIVSNPTKYGFKEVMSGCCGTGLLEASILCNPKSFVCPDASKYVFWDSIHPTEKAYFYIFNALRSSIDLSC